MFYICLVISILVSLFMAFGFAANIFDNKEKEADKKSYVKLLSAYLTTFGLSVLSFFVPYAAIPVALIHFGLSFASLCTSLKTKKEAKNMILASGKLTESQFDASLLVVLFITLCSFSWEFGLVYFALR